MVNYFAQFDEKSKDETNFFTQFDEETVNIKEPETSWISSKLGFDKFAEEPDQPVKMNTLSRTGFDELGVDELELPARYPTGIAPTSNINSLTQQREALLNEISNPLGDKFDPEGSGYDYDTAERYGMQPDETGHWASRAPDGQILKGRRHETADKTWKGERDAGYEIKLGVDGKYYSQKKEEVPTLKQTYPKTPYDELIKKFAKKYRVPFHIAYKLLETESNFDPNAISKTGAKGIAQFMDKTAKDEGIDVWNPESAIPGSLKYLRKQYDKFGNWSHAVAAYNAGRANVIKYKGIPPFKETQEHNRKVMEGYVPEEKPKVGKTVFDKETETETIQSKDTKLEQGKYKPNFIERVYDKFEKITGIKPKSKSKISSRAAAQNVIKLLAKEEGVSVGEFTEKPEFIGTAAQSFTDMVTLGIPTAIRETMTGEEKTQAHTVLDHAGQALGSLAGLIMGPLAVTKEAVGAFRLAGRGTQEGKLVANVLKEMLHDGIVVGLGMGLTTTGEALKEKTFTEAAKKLKDATRSGTFTGMVFGASRGLFPKEGAQKGARLITGLVGLNAQRAIESGGNPFTDRPIGEVIFDTALDATFLWNGLPSDKFGKLSDIVTDPKTSPKLLSNTVKESMKEAKKSLPKVKEIKAELKPETKIESKVEEKSKVVEKSNTEITPLKDKTQQDFVDKKIVELGSLEAVKKHYIKDDNISIYAREKAAEKYGGEADVGVIKKVKTKLPKDKLAIIGKSLDNNGKIIPFEKEWVAKKKMKVAAQKAGLDVTGYKVFEQDGGWVYQRKMSKWDAGKEFGVEEKSVQDVEVQERSNIDEVTGKEVIQTELENEIPTFKVKHFADKLKKKLGDEFEVIEVDKGFTVEKVGIDNTKIVKVTRITISGDSITVKISRLEARQEIKDNGVVVNRLKGMIDCL